MRESLARKIEAACAIANRRYCNSMKEPSGPEGNLDSSHIVKLLPDSCIIHALYHFYSFSSGPTSPVQTLRRIQLLKRTFIPLVLCVTFALLLVACGGSDTSSNNSTSNTANANKATTNTATTTNTTTPTTSSSGEKIGIPECDDFITKYEACINSKVPEAQRAQFKPTLEQWRSSWRSLAANPQTKGTLAGICKTSLEKAKESMKSYGCTF